MRRYKAAMRDAAPAQFRAALLVFAAACVLTGALATAGASAPRRETAKLPAALWGVELDARTARLLGPKQLAALRRAGINTLIADRRSLRGRSLARLRARAKKARLLLLAPAASKRTSVRRARVRGVRLALVRVTGPQAAARVRRSGRVVAVARLTAASIAHKQVWRAAISAARARSQLDLAVRPAGRKPTAALNALLALLTEATSAGPPPPPPPPGPPPGLANLWVDTSGGSCTRSAVPVGHVDAAACSGLQQAANAAQPGDTVNIVDGTYGGQTLTGSKPVTLRGAGPGRPSFGQLIVAASNLTVARVLVENRDDQPIPGCGSWVLDYTLFVCAPNVTFDHVIVDGLRHPSGDSKRKGGIELASGSGFVFRNGVVRGVWDSKGFQGGADNMVLENNLFHDIRITPAGAAAGVHNECAYVTEGDNQVWRRNRFVLCPVMAIFFANWLGGPPFSGVLVENNVFTHAVNDSVTDWHDGSSFVIPNGAGGQNEVRNWVVRFNVFEVAPDIARTPSTADDNGSALFYGNLGADPSCSLPEWTITYNVGSTCGRTGERAVPNATNTRNAPNQAPFYVNALGQDFHLKGGANQAVNLGAPAFPALDLDGNLRPFAGSVDAGAYERQH
jgi:hypothetical protein